MHRFTRLLTTSLVVLSAPIYATAMASDRMALTGSGHLMGDPVSQEKILSTNSEQSGVSDAVLNLQPQLSDIRHALHRIPEVGFDTPRTHEYIMKTLEEMGYDPKPVGDTKGVMVDIKGEDASFTIGVRGDFDGLPIHEVDDGREYRSIIEGQMHACGHDVHSTVVMGIALAYANKLAKPKTNLRLIFQPAEEIGQGAQALIDAGVLDGVDTMIGLHSDPTREWGRVGLTSGNWSAYATGFKIDIEGKAAHAGIAANQGKDALLAGAYVTSQMQSVVSRNIAATDAGVVSISTFTAGNVINQVADKAVLSGTTRAATKAGHELIKQRMREIVRGASIAMEMPISLAFIVEAPATINNEDLFNLAVEASTTLLGETNVDIYTQPSMGGEDFAAYSQIVPSFYYWLGVANKELGITAGLHTPEFDVDERAIPIGVALQLELIDAIAEHHSSGGELKLELK